VAYAALDLGPPPPTSAAGSICPWDLYSISSSPIRLLSSDSLDLSVLSELAQILNINWFQKEANANDEVPIFVSPDAELVAKPTRDSLSGM
jgi:hypothetical protein